MAKEIGEGAKKRILDEIGSNPVTSAIPDDKKHKVKEDSQFPDDGVENGCQIATPKTPPCLPSVETDAVAATAGTDEHAPAIVMPDDGGGGLVLPSAETCATRAGSEEPSKDIVVLNSSPIVETHATGVGAAIGAADPAPEIIVPPEGGGDLGLQSVETVAPEGGEL